MLRAPSKFDRCLWRRTGTVREINFLKGSSDIFFKITIIIIKKLQTLILKMLSKTHVFFLRLYNFLSLETVRLQLDLYGQITLTQSYDTLSSHKPLWQIQACNGFQLKVMAHCMQKEGRQNRKWQTDGWTDESYIFILPSLSLSLMITMHSDVFCMFRSKEKVCWKLRHF